MYEDLTYEVLLERMLDRVSDKLDKREGSVIFDANSPAAIEFQILYLELDTILQEAYGDTASREFLIRRCKERGIFPYEATHAVLKGVFTPATVDVTGQRFTIGTTYFTVLEKIADGEYQVQCEDTGIIGNQRLGSLIPVNYIDGLETAELTELLIPGEDEEDTEDLRKRYFDSFSQKAFGGNVQDYLEKTNAIAGVGSTKVTRTWNGDIRPTDMIPDAVVKAWYERTIGTLEQEVASWLSSVYSAAIEKKLTTGGTVLLTILNSDYGTASEALLATVQNTIDPAENAGEGYGLAPIGHVVSVKSAVEATVIVKMKIVFDAGYSWSNLQNSIDAAIEDYLLTLRKSWANTDHLIVRISQMELRVLNIEGVIDIEHTLLNGSDENLILGVYEVPVFGGASE